MFRPLATVYLLVLFGNLQAQLVDDIGANKITTTTMQPTTNNMTTTSSMTTTSVSTTNMTDTTTAMHSTTHATTANSTGTTSKPTTTSKTTKTPLITSSPAPTITPQPTIRWHVTDSHGKLCMLMDFSGTFSAYILSWISSPIPANPDIQSSSCNSTNAVLHVGFGDASQNTWLLTLEFVVKGESYIMSRMALSVVSGFNARSGSEEGEILRISNGDYYRCDSFNVSLGAVAFNLTNPIFQPFVQKTDSGTGLGKESYCTNSGSSSNTLKIIIGVAVGVGVIGVAALVTFFVVRKQRRNSTPYQNMS